MATRRWLGRAIPIPQIDTITIANTWATGDTVEITINGKSLLLTIGTDDATTDVAQAIYEILTGTAQTGTGDHTFSATGDTIGEFAELTYAVSGSVVTITGPTTGKYFTLSVTETTAGDGTATEATATTGTGPNYFSNVDNWSDDTVPVDGDTIVFDSGNVSLLYGMSAGIQPAALVITQGYEGRIGLSKVNSDNTNPDLHYDEYRTEYLTFANDAGTAATVVTIGELDGAGSERIKLDFADCTALTVNVRNSGTRAESSVPAVLILTDDTAAILNLQKGDVGVAFFEEETAHLDEVRVGYLEDQQGDSTLYLGGGVDITDATIEITGGVTSIDSTTSGGTIEITGGEVTILSGAHPDVEIFGTGVLYYQSTGDLGTTTLKVSGTLDFRRDNRNRTVPKCSAYSGARIFDPRRTAAFSTGIDLEGCRIEDVTLDLGTNFTLTPAEI